MFESGLRFLKNYFSACAAHTVLGSGFDVVDQPEQACVLFPNVEACALDQCTSVQAKAVEANIHALPHWKGGLNHVVFDYGTEHALPAYNPGKAILLGGAMTTDSYRPEYDVLLPPAQPQLIEPLPELEQAGHVLARLPASGSVADVLKPITKGRDLLMFFRGDIYGYPGDICGTRSRVFGKHFPPPQNQTDVIVIGYCARDQTRRPEFLQVAHCRGCMDNLRLGRDGKSASCTAGFPDISHADGFRRAKFAFLPRGCGSLPVRIAEAIALGAVPVLTGEGTFTPYAGEGRVGQLWRTCLIHVKEAETATLVERLRGMPEMEYHTHLGACAQIVAHRSYKMSTVVRQGMCLIASRIQKLIGPVWGDKLLVEACDEVGVDIL